MEGHRSGGIKKIFLVVPLYFLALKAQLVVLVSAFVIISTVWSVFLFAVLLLTVPPCPAICKSGGMCPMESAPLYGGIQYSGGQMR